MKRALILFLYVASSVLGTLRCFGQGVVVAAAKMNVVYVGVPNPIEVAACGYTESAVSVDADAGILTKTGAGKYNWIIMKPGVATVTVWGMKGGKKVQLVATKFRVKLISAPPVAMVANKRGGAISKSLLQAQKGATAFIENSDYEMSFRVTKFKSTIFHKSTIAYEANITGPYFSEELRLQFGQLSPGDKVLFSDVYAIGPDTPEFQINSIEFIIN